MSRATNQTIVLFSVMGGCFVRILSDDMFSAIYMRDHTFATYKKTIQVMEKWPKTGDAQKNIKWIGAKLDQWEQHIKEVGDYYSKDVFAAVASRCLSDIEAQVHDPYKLKLLQSLKDDVERITEFTDPTGEKFSALEKSGEIMSGLYKIIGWELGATYKMRKKKDVVQQNVDIPKWKPTPLQEALFSMPMTGRISSRRR